MKFIKDLAGGFVLLIIAAVIGVAHNAVRGNPVKLILEAPKVVERPADETHVDRVEGESDGPAHHRDPSDVSKEQLQEMMATGMTFVIDARGEEEYAEGHISGAINVPYEKFIDYYEALTDYVPRDANVVVYCTSVTCDLGDRLMIELKLDGYENVVLYRDGWDEWSESDLPVETGAWEY